MATPINQANHTSAPMSLPVLEDGSSILFWVRKWSVRQERMGRYFAWSISHPFGACSAFLLSHTTQEKTLVLHNFCQFIDTSLTMNASSLVLRVMERSHEGSSDFSVITPWGVLQVSSCPYFLNKPISFSFLKVNYKLLLQTVHFICILWYS